MKQLLTHNIWTHCTTNHGKTPSGRAPALGLGKTKPISYDQARANAEKQICQSPYWGMVFTEESQYIGIDVDVDPTGKKQNSTLSIPPIIDDILTKYPTHAHYSVSGHGLHIIYKLDDDARTSLVMRGVKQCAYDGDFKGDIRFRFGFLVFTDNEHPKSVEVIRTLSLDELDDILPELKTKPKTKEKQPSNDFLFTHRIPSLKVFTNTLNAIPSTFNYKAEQAINSLPYPIAASNYEYWVAIGSACAHYEIALNQVGRQQESSQVIEAFVKWSMKDEEGFTSEEDVVNKYNSLYSSTKDKLKANQQVTTFNTLLALASKCTIDFPDLISTGKKGHLRPDPQSTRNIDALMEHEGLKLIFDSMAGGFCFKGPEEIISQWFCPDGNYGAVRPPGYSQAANFSDFCIRVRPYLQHCFKHSISARAAKDAIDHLSQGMEYENTFKRWILSKPWDGNERFDDVCGSIDVLEIEQVNEAMYNSYIRRSLLAMVGIHFWPEDSPKISAMLVLTGPENTYKSSWASWLIPKEMSNYIATPDLETVTNGGKDWQIFLSTKAVVVLDECEPLFTPKYEQKVKSSVDTESVTFRDLYATQLLTRTRTALIIGTTNKQNLYTGSTGTRKIWQIPVANCDSMLIKNMDLQQLYAEVYAVLCKYKQENPDKLIQSAWTLSKEDRVITNKLNAIKKGAAIGVLALLSEKFGHPLERRFDPSSFISSRGLTLRKAVPGDLSNDPNAWSISAMFQFLKMEFPDDRITRTEVRYAIEEYAATYTQTVNEAITPFKDQFGKRWNKTINRGYLAVTPTSGFYILPSIIKNNSKTVEILEPNLKVVGENNEK